MHNNIPEKTESLFFELAGDLRLSMLLKLSQHKYRLSQLSTELDATMQEAHRNIIRLVEAGLVFKDGEGDLGLTSYGKSIVFLIPGYEFLFGVMAILQRWKTLYWNAKLYIKEIMSQVPLDLIETVSNKIETGIKFSYIFSKDTIIPKGRGELLQKIGWVNQISKGMVERKMINKVTIMTIFNEQEACLLFPNLKGEPDLNIMFYSKDRNFHDWCKDFFDYQWDMAGPFDDKKLNET